MNRRNFITSLFVSTFSAASINAKGLGHQGSQRILLTIDGIDFTTNAESLGATLASFLTFGLPVNLVVDIGHDTSHLSINRGLVNLLNRYITSFPGMFELVPFLSIWKSAAPFEAARSAYNLRENLAVFNSVGSDSPNFGRSVYSVACNIPIDSKAGDALISAGFRNILALPEFDTSVIARVGRQGVLTLLGGERAEFASVVVDLNRPVASLQRHLIFSVRDSSTAAMQDVQESTRRLGQLLRQRTLDQQVVTVLADELQARTDVEFRRRVVIHIVDSSEMNDIDKKVADRFCSNLDDAGFHFSRTRDTLLHPSAYSGRQGVWISLEKTNFTPRSFTTRDPIEKRPFERGFFAFVGATDDEPIGLSSQAELTVPILLEIKTGSAVEEYTAHTLAERGDGIILIHFEAISKPADYASTLRFLTLLKRTPDIHFVDLPSLCKLVLPRDDVLTSLFLAQEEARRRLMGSTFTIIGTRIPSDILEDARVAWNYFDQSTVAATGLCPATINTSGNTSAGSLSISMWEVGSHIQALISAVDLGLIKEADFVNRADKILNTLERVSNKKLALPPEIIQSSTGNGTTRFNSFDTGRLLIALDRLRKHPLSPSGLEVLVRGWDFTQIIQDRRLNSVRAGQLVDDFESNYADYVAQGFRLWGYDVASPLDEFSTPINADQGIKLLRMASSFGPIGAEPWLLQFLEIGSSPAAGFIIDYYKAAMFDMELRSGYLVAPSESPINQPPWFTYQGFNPTRPDHPSSIEFAGKGMSDNSEDVSHNLLATSSKAAYLLAAIRPDGKVWGLLSDVRGRARGRLGFDSAIFAKNNETTLHYTDLNTNAIILHSVAHILGKS